MFDVGKLSLGCPCVHVMPVEHSMIVSKLVAQVMGSTSALAKLAIDLMTRGSNSARA